MTFYITFDKLLVSFGKLLILGKIILIFFEHVLQFTRSLKEKNAQKRDKFFDKFSSFCLSFYGVFAAPSNNLWPQKNINLISI